VNIDQWPGAHPDIVARSSSLPLADGSMSRAYCGHVLEHLEFDTELPATLLEIRRVLDGPLCIVGPDYDRALANPEWHPLIPGIVDGADRWPGDKHQWLSSGPKTLDAVLPIFPSAQEVDITTLSDWPLVDDVGWQFAIIA
jgi:hypothetical protein